MCTKYHFPLNDFYIKALNFIISANMFRFADCVSKNIPIEAMIDQASRFLLQALFRM